MYASGHGSTLIMNHGLPRKKYWPYDELKISRDVSEKNRIIFDTPWLRHEYKVDSVVADQIEKIIQNLNSGQIAAEDLDDVSWLLESVQSYPFSYLLPRPENVGSDIHNISKDMTGTSPYEVLMNLLADVKNSGEALKTAARFKDNDWTWDTQAVLEFSQTPTGYDPESVFSICRRFHLLNDIENNKTADLLAYISQLDKNDPQFKYNNAVVIKQNYYVTMECEDVLSASLPIAQSAEAEVREFVDAEAGHDKILEIALKSMGLPPSEVPILSSIYALMGLFKKIAQTNFLAFSIMVDVFERSSYLPEDPFAKVLKEGGSDKAAHQLDAHRHINEAGGHENVAIGFLQNMMPVSREYAEQAIRLAELATLVVHVVSKETLENIKQKQ